MGQRLARAAWPAAAAQNFKCYDSSTSATCSGAVGDHLAALRPLRPRSISQSALLDHVEVVLDHEHGVAPVDQPLENLEQLLDVGEVRAGRRLVEDVERLAGRDLGELFRQLHALRLAAGERRRGLAELDVVEPDVVEGLQLPPELGIFAKN